MRIVESLLVIDVRVWSVVITGRAQGCAGKINRRLAASWLGLPGTSIVTIVR